MYTIKQTLAAARQRLVDADLAAQEADILLSHVLGCDNTHLIAWPDKQVTELQQKEFENILERRLQGVPVAYLKGEKEFWSRNFVVDESTLIPRPETELLIEFVLQQFEAESSLRVADLGTGSGVIGITLACERPDWQITASDTSAAALKIAKMNAAQSGLQNIVFEQGSWCDVLRDRQHLIISNPPYIANSDPHLSQGDVRFEPVTALESGEDGLDDIRTLCQQAPAHLLAGGCLIIEHGYDQKAAVRALFEEFNFIKIIQLNDYAEQPRITAGYLPAD